MTARRHTLQAGDRVRLLRVPKLDLEQRDRERSQGIEAAGFTADTIERILALDPVTTITEVDADGTPWFDYELTDDDGVVVHHSIAILDDESWEWI